MLDLTKPCVNQYVIDQFVDPIRRDNPGVSLSVALEMAKEKLPFAVEMSERTLYRHRGRMAKGGK